MRCLKRNKQTFYYCLYDSASDIKDTNGNLTGEQKIAYHEAVEMQANISPATGQSNIEQFGNLENYDKVIVTADMNCPIDENTVLFIDKDPEYPIIGQTQDTPPKPVYDYTQPIYDYVVRRVSKSLNSISIAVRKVTVS